MFAYMEILFELDILRDRYSSYYTYSVFAKARGRIEFFINSYSALVIQHYSIYKILKKIKDKNLVAFLNQEFPEQQVAAGTYDRLKEQVENHLERLSDSISGHFWLIIKRPLDYFEKQSYKVWSPLMERAALRITFIRMTDREFHITAKQIQSYVGRLETGDILFERREWNANNLGIPGFWTHNALYVGSIDKLDRELQGVAELNGLSFSQYLQKENPDAYNKMLSRDKFGYEYAIIELKRGVIFESLEESTRADSLGVLRVKNLTASDKFNIVMEAMSHVGKPYDYDFDFSTDNALICSELTYKSHKVTGKLHADLRTVSGRPMISPNQLAEKFVQEYKRDSELEFVLFLDGDEKEGVAHEYGVDEFISSVSRPKWNAARQLVGSR